MTDLRTRAITALSSACFADAEAREQTIRRVVAFVEAEIAAENEACARIFDAMAPDSRESALHAPEGFARTLINADAFAMQGYAAAIRARRETPA